MQWADALENINYLSVVLGVVVALVVGFVWYGSALFGNNWAKLIGFKKKDMEDKSGMPVMMAMMAVFYAILSVTIAVLFELTNSEGQTEGLLLGAILGFAFGLGPIAVSYAFARRKFELAMIDGGFVVVTSALIGVIVGWLA